MLGLVYTSDTETCARDVHPSNANASTVRCASTLEHSACQHDGRTFALALSRFSCVKFKRKLSANARKGTQFCISCVSLQEGKFTHALSCACVGIARVNLRQISSVNPARPWTYVWWKDVCVHVRASFARKSCEPFSLHLLGLPSL